MTAGNLTFTYYCNNNFKLIPKLVKAVLNVCEVYGWVMFES